MSKRAGQVAWCLKHKQEHRSFPEYMCFIGGTQRQKTPRANHLETSCMGKLWVRLEDPKAKNTMKEIIKEECQCCSWSSAFVCLCAYHTYVHIRTNVRKGPS